MRVSKTMNPGSDGAVVTVCGKGVVAHADYVRETIALLDQSTATPETQSNAAQ